MSLKTLLLAFALATPFSVAQAQAKTLHFTVRIENISTTNQFTASNGTKWTLDFSRGVYAVSSADGPLFSAGTKDRAQGLQSLSEDGDPAMLGKSLAQTYGNASGEFLTAAGAMKPGGIRPGHAFEFTVTAQAGQRLYFATMFGQSNDWFYAPDENGIALFDGGGNPIAGDITSQVKLWDAGTEADEELGIGPHQGPRQPHPRYGDPDRNPIVHIATSDPRFLDVTQVMRVTVTPKLSTSDDVPHVIAQRNVLTLEGAQRVIAAAESAALATHSHGAIAVVDEGGNLIAAASLDGTFPQAAQVAIGKAHTAAVFRKDTSFFENSINRGRTTLVAMQNFTPLQGGVLITIDGEVVGAVGVSGTASQQQDEDVAKAGARTLQR